MRNQGVELSLDLCVMRHHCVFLSVLGRSGIVDDMEVRGGLRWEGIEARKETGAKIET